MKKEDRFPLFCLLIIIAAFIIGSINPIYFESWFAESLFTIIIVLLLAIFYINKKFRFSNLSYALITLYLILHTIGSHYTYPETPIGFWISSIFGFTRNHYDRIIHFLWGLLIYIPALEITKRLIPIKKQKANLFYYLVPVFALISLGALYEVIEWIAVILAAPELGISYLGAQGDIWDAQKDLALNIIGSFAMALFIHARETDN